MTEEQGDRAEATIDRPPSAIIEPREGAFGGGGLIWGIPLIVAMVVAVIAWRAWSDRAFEVVVDFETAHGLAGGDPVRSFGIEVGSVSSLELVHDPSRPDRPIVRATLAIDPEDRDLLRTDTVFWIEHPRVDFGGVGGLDTITGPRYVGMSPGSGDRDRGPFIGLARPPVAASHADGLQVVLHASDRAGMREGGAVTYRGVQIGRILDVGLAPRASRVEATVLIDGRYAPIVRTNSRFFSTSGIGFELGFDGLRADVESLESMVAGGVGVATPNRLGDPAEPGARYPLQDRADPGWLEWDPEIDLDVDGVD